MLYHDLEEALRKNYITLTKNKDLVCRDYHYFEIRDETCKNCPFVSKTGACTLNNSKSKSLIGLLTKNHPEHFI